MPKNKKQKTSHGPPNANKKSPPSWTPADIQANPKLYSQQIPNVLRREKTYAFAALLGLSSSSLSVHDQGRDPSKEGVVAEISKKCPNVFNNDPSLFHKLLMESDATTINLLLRGAPPLISTVSLDLELALLAVQKAPLCYLHLPPNLLMKCSNEDKKKLGSAFHKLLLAGDKDTIDLLLTGPPPMISKVEWNRDLALQAVRETPRLYEHLPEALKNNDTELALTAILSPKADVNAIVGKVQSCCNDLFWNPTALKELFEKGGKELIMTILKTFSDKIVWDQDLVDLACNRYPASYCFLPAGFRSDNIDAQRVMSSLLKVQHSNNELAVRDAITSAPDFFADRDAVHQLFLMADSDLVKQIVKSISPKLPWDKELARLAVKRVNFGEYSRNNLNDDEIRRIYKGSSECRYHLPLGMLISYVVSDATDVDEWPDFFNKCRCHLAGDDSVLLEALQFVVPMLQNMKHLSSDVREWAQGLVCRFTKDLGESRETLQTLLRCIHVVGSGEPLECLKGDDETSIALKRHIAEFLGAIGVGGARRAKLKRDALKLVFCLTILPSEFPNEGLDTSSFLGYQADSHMEDTFYCVWCCRTLAKLDKKYTAKENNVEDDDTESSDDDVNWDSSEDNHDDDSDDDSDEDDSDDTHEDGEVDERGYNDNFGS